MADEPVIDLRVFKMRSYSTGVFLMTTLGFVLYGSLVLLPIMLQTLLGYPSLQAGIAMAPRGMGSLIGMPSIGLLIGGSIRARWWRRPHRRRRHAVLARRSSTCSAGYWDIFWPQFLQGIGLSMLFVPLTTISMDPIPRERMGNATSLFNLMRNLGGSIGIAMTGTLLARKQQAYINVLGAHVNAYSPARAARSNRLAGLHRGGRGHRRPRRSAPTRRCSAWCSSRRRWCRSSSCSACWASCSCARAAGHADEAAALDGRRRRRALTGTRTQDLKPPGPERRAVHNTAYVPSLPAYRFAGFLVSRRRRQLLRQGEMLPLIPKSFDLLVLLIERRPDVVAAPRDLRHGVA